MGLILPLILEIILSLTQNNHEYGLTLPNNLEYYPISGPEYPWIGTPPTSGVDYHPISQLESTWIMTHFTSNVDYHPISNQCLFKIIGGEYLDIIVIIRLIFFKFRSRLNLYYK